MATTDNTRKAPASDAIKPAPNAQKGGEGEQAFAIVNVNEFSDAVKQMSMLPSGGLLIKDAAVKYREGDEQMGSIRLIEAIRAEFEACNSRLKALVGEYGGCVKGWEDASKMLEPFFFEAQNSAPKATQKEISQMVQDAAPDLFKNAVSAFSSASSKEGEVREMRSKATELRRLFKQACALLTLEKELESARLECAKLQEKIDLYPETARIAEEQNTALCELVGKSMNYSDLKKHKVTLARERELAVEAAEKHERRGGSSSRDEVKRIDAEIAKTEEMIRQTEAEVRAARPSFAYGGIGEIAFQLKQEYAEANELINNYDESRSKDLARLRKLEKRAVSLEGKFEAEKKGLMKKMTEEGISA